MSKRMRKNAPWLLELNKVRKDKPKFKRMLGNGKRGQICAIAEIAKNVTHKKIKLSPMLKALMCKHKRQIRDIAKKEKFKVKRRKLIKGGFATAAALLISAAAPYLYQWYKNSRKK